MNSPGDLADAILASSGHWSNLPATRILLTTLSVRTAAMGSAYRSGWFVKVSAAEPDKLDNPTALSATRT